MGWRYRVECLSIDIPWTSQLRCHPWILEHGMEVQCRVSVHGSSMDVPVTVPSVDTRTWDEGTEQSVCPQTFHGRPSYCAICGYQDMGQRCRVECLSIAIPWTSQLLCNLWILGQGVEVQSRVSVHRHSMDVPVTVLSAKTGTWGGVINCRMCLSTNNLWMSQLLCHPWI